MKYVPIKDKDILILKWILPYFELDVDHHPLSYFQSLFGHEGENSLLSYLISEGLAYELGCGQDHSLKAFSSLTVSVSLTKRGLTEY